MSTLDVSPRDVILRAVIARSAARSSSLASRDPFCVVTASQAAANVAIECNTQGWACDLATATRFVRSVMASQVALYHARKIGPDTWECGPFCLFAEWKYNEFVMMLLGDCSETVIEDWSRRVQNARYEYEGVSLYGSDQLPF